MKYDGLPPVERLIALAGTEHVGSYMRKTKSGKTVHVSAYTRSPGDMNNNELFKEYTTLKKGSEDTGLSNAQAKNRLNQITNEIRDRKNKGTWGQARKTDKTKAVQKIDPKSGSKHSTKEQFAQNKVNPQPKAKDEDYAAHVERVQKILQDKETQNKYDTQLMHGIRDPESGKPIPGLYTPQRTEQHKAIVQSILDKHKEVPRERKAIMSGGLGGAGKGFVLKKHADVDKSKFLTIDPDEMKQELLSRGMVPEVPGLLPMEHAAFMHEESSDLANLLQQVALSQGMNIILDTTMASEDSVKKKLDKFKANDYDVEAVFVDVPVDVSQASALGRHRGGVDRFRGGVDADHGEFGGRFVPPEYIEKSRPPKGSPYNSKNREVFESLKAQGVFSRSRVFDNSDRSPKSVPKLIADSNVQAPEAAKNPGKQSAKALETVPLSAVDRLLLKLTNVTL